MYDRKRINYCNILLSHWHDGSVFIYHSHPLSIISNSNFKPIIIIIIKLLSWPRRLGTLTTKQNRMNPDFKDFVSYNIYNSVLADIFDFLVLILKLSRSRRTHNITPQWCHQLPQCHNNDCTICKSRVGSIMYMYMYFEYDSHQWTLSLRSTMYMH